MSESRAGRPRADVFFSSELFSTIRLARMGLLEPYDPPTAADIPTRYRDPDHHWTALGVRARVIAFDPRRVGAEALPAEWEDLARPEFAKDTAIANPLFGTTRGHVSAMFAGWGNERARRFLTKLRESGAHVLDGNSATVRAVIAGRARFACTDTDDVWVAQRSGASLDLIYPDMGDGGTLLIPCSVALIKGRPDNDAARRLVNFLVSAEVERMLAESDSRNVPVREDLRTELKMPWPGESKVSFDAIADAMEEAMNASREILLR
jgi:iron(III) transport system substrate-binding protein